MDRSSPKLPPGGAGAPVGDDPLGALGLDPRKADRPMLGRGISPDGRDTGARLRLSPPIRPTSPNPTVNSHPLISLCLAAAIPAAGALCPSARPEGVSLTPACEIVASVTGESRTPVDRFSRVLAEVSFNDRARLIDAYSQLRDELSQDLARWQLDPRVSGPVAADAGVVRASVAVLLADVQALCRDDAENWSPRRMRANATLEVLGASYRKIRRAASHSPFGP